MDTKKLRQKILDLAIRGKLVPQDSNDEPASVLLERIKAEKERLIKEGKIKRSKKSAKTSDTPHYENVPFEVPESWVWCKFQDCMDVRDGTHDSPKYTQEGYPLITSKDFKNGQFDFSKTRYISEVDYKNIIKRSKVDIGDILYSMIGGNIGSMIYIQHDNYFDMAIKNVALFKPYQNSDISTKYIAYFLESKIKEYQAIAIGGAQPFVGLDIFRNTLVPLPPLAEQHRIITEIEKWLALIDQIEQGKVDLQTIIKQTKSKILDLAIHGKLVPQDPNDEPAIKLLKRINPDFTPCDNGHSEKFPQDWEHILIGDYVEAVTDFVASGSFASLRENVKYYNEPNYAILVRTKDFQNNFKQDLVYTDQHGYDFLAKSNLFGGELIFSNVGSIGKIFIVPELNQKMTLAPNAIMVRFHNDKQQKWFYYLFSSTTGQSLLDSITSATAIGKFNKTDFKKLPIPIPPLAEQQRIVQKIEELFSVLDNIQNALEV